MKQRIGKRLIAIILSLCMIFSMMAVATVSVGAENATTYISEVKVSAASSLDAARSNLSKEDYTVIGHDMNNHVDNQKTWIYVGYKTTTNPNEAITGLALYNDQNPPNTYVYRDVEYTIESNKVDLNKDAGGDHIYLYYTKSAKTGERITALDAAATYDGYSLWQKDGYKTVVSMQDNLPLNANDGSNDAKPVYLVYQSEDTEAYNKKGENEPLKTVNAVNGVTYYDCDHITNSSDFYRCALTTGYDGASQVELWANVFYSMLEAKGNGWGYRLNNYSFDDGLGTGKSIDMVSALTNGTGNKKTEYWNVWVKSTGVKTTSDVNEVYNQIRHLFDEGPYSDISGSYVVDDQLGGTDKFLQSSESDIVYTLCSFADDNAVTGHEQTQSVMGMMFYNFEFVPIIGDNQDNITLNYSAISEPKSSPDLSYIYSANYSPNKTNSTISFNKSVAVNVTNSLENTASNTTSFTQGISGSLDVGKKSWPVKFSIGVEFGFGESFTNSSSTGFSNSKSDTEDKAYSNTFDIPPYSIATVEQSVTDIERSQQYDCPMALTYDVAFISFGAEMGKKNIFYTSCAYETEYYATFGDGDTTAVEALANFTSGVTNPKGVSVMCDGSEDDSFSSYNQSQVNTIVNTSVKSSEYPNTCSNAVKAIKSSQPMSYNGGEIKYTGQSVTYVDEVFSVLPIQKIKIYSYETAEKDNLVKSISINDTNSHSINKYYNNIEAYTCMNTEFTGWDASQGYWVLVTENGDQLPIGKTAVSDGVISAKADSKTGEIFITPIANGSSYVQYVINENVFMYYYTDKNNNGVIDESEKINGGTFDTNNLIYSKNSDITDTYNNGVIRIDVSNQEKNSESNGATFIIETYDDLCNMADMVNGGKDEYVNGSYILVNDIDCKGKAWTTTIGTDTIKFNGTFDGQGYTISNLNVDSGVADEYRHGLFAVLGPNAVVKNLNIDNASIFSSVKNKNPEGAGAIAKQNNGTIKNCMVTNSSIQLGNVNYFGGIAGFNNGTIENCAVVNSNLTRRFGGSSSLAMGGITEVNHGTVKNCYTYGCSFKNGTADNGAIIANGNAPENCYYYTASNVNKTYGIERTAEQFVSGEVAYLLNGEVTNSTQVWYQNIDNGLIEDSYPVLANNSQNTVYYNDNKNYYTNFMVVDNLVSVNKPSVDNMVSVNKPSVDKVEDSTDPTTSTKSQNNEMSTSDHLANNTQNNNGVVKTGNTGNVMLLLLVMLSGMVVAFGYRRKIITK